MCLQLVVQQNWLGPSCNIGEILSDYQQDKDMVFDNQLFHKAGGCLLGNAIFHAFDCVFKTCFVFILFVDEKS